MAQTDIERIWELMTSISFCMLSNWDGARIHSRPMGAVVRPQENAIYFFTDDRAHKDHEIRQYPKVCLAFADPHRQKYVLFPAPRRSAATSKKSRNSGPFQQKFGGKRRIIRTCV